MPRPHCLPVLPIFPLPTEKHSSPSPDWNQIVIPAVCVGMMVTTTVLVLDNLRRARRKGSYELAKCKPGTA